MERFMQPCLLLLLQRRSTHGYELIQNLDEFGFSEGEADPGSVYRHLRRLEDDGLVTSEWQTQESGPAKRLYRLTPDGEEVLSAWARTIARNKARLENFLARYQEQAGRD
ncbi:MAG: helix-turn-helix transcriptional regulator [Bacillota bacterium]|nr:helix-turn-helix transcriptional regulator [Bacillota bacterium]